MAAGSVSWGRGSKVMLLLGLLGLLEWLRCGWGLQAYPLKHRSWTTDPGSSPLDWFDSREPRELATHYESRGGTLKTVLTDCHATTLAALPGNDVSTASAETHASWVRVKVEGES